MIRGISYSKPIAAAAMGALALGGVLFLLRTSASARLSEQRREAAEAEGKIRRQIAGLSAYESGNLEDLHRRISRFRERLGTDGTWESLVRRLGSGWVAESGARDDRKGYFLQAGTLSLVAHTVEEWPVIVDAVRVIEAVPGVAVSGFEMRASGSGERRSLDKATVQVEIQASSTEASLIKKP
jgi:hypothetical protein